MIRIIINKISVFGISFVVLILLSNTCFSVTNIKISDDDKNTKEVVSTNVSVNEISNRGINKGEISNSANLLEVLVALLVIVVFIFLVAWLMKRIGYTGMPRNKVMNIQACLPLSSKERLLLIDIGGEQVVVGVAPGFVGHIKSLDKPLDIKSSPSSTGFSKNDFSLTLKKIINTGKNNQSTNESSYHG